jgi:CRISPR-associated protein Csm1
LKHLHLIVQKYILGNDIPTSDAFKKALAWHQLDPSVVWQPAALQPVLGNLNGHRTNSFFQGGPLSISDDFFPNSPSTPNETDIVRQWELLKRELLVAGDNEDKLLRVLDIHGSSLAIKGAISDISVFDWTKTAAALTFCFSQSNQVRLIGGGISGIQTYLYDIVSKRAAKLLKGRSFYVHLLADSLCQSVLDTFSLPKYTVLYASGGGCYIILPDVEGLEDTFEDLKKAIYPKIYKQHKTSLYAEFALTDAFSTSEVVSFNWQKLVEKLDACKTQRLDNNALLLRDLLLCVEEGGEKFRDHITNEETEAADSQLMDSADVNSRVTKFTAAQINFGKALREAKYWVYSKASLSITYLAKLKDPLGNWHYLLDEDNAPQNLPIGTRMRQFNAPTDINLDFTFYGGNDFPAFDEPTHWDGDDYEVGAAKPHGLLAQGVHLHRLGILRMDVDGLGTIFSQQIGSNLARYVATSRSLDWFFKGYLNQIHQFYRETTIVIYSGGDDLFIVGKWNDVLEMAQDIQTEFNKWTDTALTISGGLSILPAKFPIMQGARLAGEAEKEAKKRQNTEGLKNAFSLFDHTLGWSFEFEEVLRLKAILYDLLDNHNVSISLLRKIATHAEAQRYQRKHKEPERWAWLMAYDFARYAEVLEKKNKQAAAKVVQMRIDAFSDEAFRKNRSSHSYLTLLNLAARWIELEARTEGKNFNNNNND